MAICPPFQEATVARHPTRWLIPLLSMLALPAWAGVEVFTTAGQPVINVPSEAAVVELDAPARLDTQFSADLSGDRQQAQQEAMRRLQAPDWQAKREALERAAMGTARAWMIGIEKVPGQQRLVQRQAILAATVTMHDHSLGHLTTPQGHLQGIADQVGGIHSLIAQPTTLREYTSPVARYVMSPTHVWFGAVAVKSCSSRFGATGSLC